MAFPHSTLGPAAILGAGQNSMERSRPRETPQAPHPTPVPSARWEGDGGFCRALQAPSPWLSASEGDEGRETDFSREGPATSGPAPTLFLISLLGLRADGDRNCSLRQATGSPRRPTHPHVEASRPPETGSASERPAAWEEDYATGPCGARLASITTSPKRQTQSSDNDKLVSQDFQAR